MLRGQALCYTGRLQESEASLEDAERLARPEPGLLRSELFFAMGDCWFDRDRVKAREFFVRSSTYAHGQDGYMEARALANLGFLSMQEQHYDQAIDEFRKALAIAESPWLKEIILGDMGECFIKLGDWKSAASYSGQAEQLAAQVPDAKVDRARWLIDLGLESNSQLKFDDAEARYDAALEIVRRAGNADLQARCLINLGWLALAHSKTEQATNYIGQARGLQLSDGPMAWLQLEEAKLALLKGDVSSAEKLLRSELMGLHGPDLEWHAYSELAGIETARKNYDSAERDFQKAVAAAERALTQINSDEFRISFLDLNPFYDQYIRFLVQRGRVIDALRIAERGRAPSLRLSLVSRSGYSGPDLHRIQQNLGASRETALVYWLSPQCSYLWVVSGAGIRLFRLPDEMKIANAVDAYNTELLNQTGSDVPDGGRELYRMLVQPAENLIPPGGMVVVVPHRRLYKLNFETLVTPGSSPHYWIEHVCLQTASLLSLIETGKSSNHNYQKDMLLIGAPVEADKDYPPLTHAADELKEVADTFPDRSTKLIEGKDATPGAYFQSAPAGYRYIHFATHGTASDINPLDSAIILSPGRAGYKLYARDIIREPIHPELVTISTCYGAGTRQYSGEGLVGLAWAFMRVGARHVIAALWEVDDAANSALMGDFYRERRSGKSVAIALRDAKLKMLSSHTTSNAPYYWASLQLYMGPQQ